MKHLLFIFTLLTTMVSAQNVKVKTNRCLNEKLNERYFYPVISPDGTSVAFTNENFQSLLLMNIETKKIVKITENEGAGYEPLFSADGSKIYYRSNTYEGMKKFSSVSEYSIGKRQTTELLDKNRDVRLIASAEGNIILAKENEIKSYSGKDGSLKRSSDDTFVYIQNSKMLVYENGNSNTISPLGEYNYIWPSFSPNKQKLLFTVAGKGTYICNADGSNAISLGYLNAPKWLNDNWIVGMKDKDNGEVFISSDIYLISADATQTVQLTETNDEIEMYPQVLVNQNKIAYHTDKGKIYVMELEF